MPNKLEICLTPALYPCHSSSGVNVVIIDILRATSSICTAFMNGAEKLIPVGDPDTLREYKEKGYVVSGERDGITLDFADFGNSPSNFTNERVQGKTVVYTTTNGTKSIMMASNSHSVTIGAYLNISALSGWLVKQNRDVLLFCAGWKNRFNLEDTLFAGAMSRKLLDSGCFRTECDSVEAALDLWKIAEPDLLGYIKKAAQYTRLKIKNLDEAIPYCHTSDLTNVIPLLDGDGLIPIVSE